MARPRDSQRQKFFDWRGTVLRDHLDARNVRWTIDEAEDITKKMMLRYGLTPIPVQRRGNPNYYSSGFQPFIGVDNRQLESINFLTLLAYAIHDKRGHFAWHGPEFMRIYLELISDTLNVPLSEVRSLATAAKLRVAQPSKTPGLKPTGSRTGKQLQKAIEERASLDKSLRLAEEEFKKLLAPVKAQRAALDRRIQELREKSRNP
jgi:hypothetical protein